LLSPESSDCSKARSGKALWLHDCWCRECTCEVSLGQRSAEEDREVKRRRKTNAKKLCWSNTSYYFNSLQPVGFNWSFFGKKF